MFLEVSWINVF